MISASRGDAPKEGGSAARGMTNILLFPQVLDYGEGAGA